MIYFLRMTMHFGIWFTECVERSGNVHAVFELRMHKSYANCAEELTQENNVLKKISPLDIDGSRLKMWRHFGKCLKPWHLKIYRKFVWTDFLTSEWATWEETCTDFRLSLWLQMVDWHAPDNYLPVISNFYHFWIVTQLFAIEELVILPVS